MEKKWDLKKIRRELKNGKTIERVCTEYKISFKKLVELMLADQYQQDQKSIYGLYIHRNSKGRFVIQRKGNYYGTYKTWYDAFRVRNYFMRCGWDKDRLDEVCEQVGVERCYYWWKR